MLISFQAHASEEGILGLWQTESTDKGYLFVSIENCGNAVCGVIQQANDLKGEPDSQYEFLGEKMIWDMVSKGENRWSGGKIWDPSKDKTYKSKMSLNKDVLDVSGCIAFICRSQRWTRVTQ